MRRPRAILALPASDADASVATRPPAWLFRRPAPTASRSGALWPGETRRLIQHGAVLPIISNYLLPRSLETEPSVLAYAWAQNLESPLTEPENSDLARVAQFYSIAHGDLRSARIEYHNALRGFLLDMARHQAIGDQDCRLMS